MRLIDADALKELFLKNCGCDCYLCKNYYYDKQIEKAYCHLIDKAPTIDSLDLDVNIGGRRCGKRQRLLDELRPKGKWIEDSGNIACSQCHTIWLYRRTDFCPNCGADMRGEDV